MRHRNPHKAGSARTVGDGPPEFRTHTGPPAILVRIGLEDTPAIVVEADTWEDEQRFGTWVASPFVRRRTVAAMDAAIGQFGERRAA